MAKVKAKLIKEGTLDAYRRDLNEYLVNRSVTKSKENDCHIKYLRNLIDSIEIGVPLRVYYLSHINTKHHSTVPFIKRRCWKKRGVRYFNITLTYRY